MSDHTNLCMTSFVYHVIRNFHADLCYFDFNLENQHVRQLGALQNDCTFVEMVFILCFQYRALENNNSLI
jgi:hypothetical protein